MANPVPLEDDYTYESSGMDGFFTRQQDRSSPLESEGGDTSSGAGLNFDNLQIDGSLGDTLRIGRIYFNGADGNIIINDGENDRVLIGLDVDGF